MLIQILTSSTEVRAATLGRTSPSTYHLSLEIIPTSYLITPWRNSWHIHWTQFRQRHHLLFQDSTGSRNHKPPALNSEWSDRASPTCYGGGEEIIGKRNTILTLCSLWPWNIAPVQVFLHSLYRDWIYLSGNRNWVSSYLGPFPDIHFQRRETC